MSLINDALRKSRSGAGEPASGSLLGQAPAPRPLQRGRPAGPPLVPVLLGAVSAAVVVTGLLVYLMMKGGGGESPAAAADSVAGNPVPPRPPSAADAAAGNESAGTAPVASPGILEAETAAVTVSVAPSEEEQVQEDAVRFLEAITVSGTRISPAGNTAIINSRRYNEGDLLQVRLGLRLVGVSVDELVFEDAWGRRYYRLF